MAIFPYKFSSDSSLKPKTSRDTKKKEVKAMACGSKKSSTKKSSTKKCSSKKGGCK